MKNNSKKGEKNANTTQNLLYFPVCVAGKSHLAGFFHEQLHERFALVLDAVVQNGILQVQLQDTHLTGGLQMEHFHDFVAVDDGLQQAFVVFFLQVGELFADDANADFLMRGISATSIFVKPTCPRLIL